jgi:hypothetical protein
MAYVFTNIAPERNAQKSRFITSLRPKACFSLKLKSKINPVATVRAREISILIMRIVIFCSFLVNDDAEKGEGVEKGVENGEYYTSYTHHN